LLAHTDASEVVVEDEVDVVDVAVVVVVVTRHAPQMLSRL